MASRSDVLRLAVRLIGPLLLATVIWRIDDKEALWGAIKEANWPLLGFTSLLTVPMIHFKIVRWRGLLADRGYPYPLRRSYAAVLASMYLGMLTPGRVGDVLRIQYVRREIDAPYAEGLAATIMDRFSDLYVVAAVAALGTVHFASVLRGDLANATWLAVAIALVTPLLVLAKGPAELFGVLLARFAERWQTNLDAVLQALRGLTRKSIFFAIPLTSCSWAISYAQGWLIAQAIGIDLSYVDVAALLSATSLLGLLPISISGIGVRELFLALVFPAVGFLPAQGVAFGLLVFVCINFVVVVMGFFAWQIAPPPFDPRQAGKAPARR